MSNFRWDNFLLREASFNRFLPMGLSIEDFTYLIDDFVDMDIDGKVFGRLGFGIVPRFKVEEKGFGHEKIKVLGTSTFTVEY